MDGFIEVLKLLAKGSWPPVFIGGLVLFLVLDARMEARHQIMEVRLDAQDRRLDRIEDRLDRIDGRLDRIEQQGAQRDVRLAVLESQTRRLDPKGSRANADEAPAEAGSP